MLLYALRYSGFGFSLIVVIFAGANPLFADDKNVFALGRVGLNISELSGQGDGFGVSPELSIGGEYLAHRYFAIDLYLGYLQARLPLATGLIRADFFKSALYFVGRYPMKIFIPYVFLGGYANVHFSSEYEEASTGTIYDRASSFNPAHFGLSGGLGLQMHIWLIDVFADVMYSWGINNSIKEVQSSILTLQPAPDYSVQIYLGAKYAVYKI